MHCGSLHGFQRLAIAAAAVVLIHVAPGAAATDHPVFKRGLWQNDLTMWLKGKPIKLSKTVCEDPTLEIEGMLEPGNTFGCVQKAAVHSGNQFRTESNCSGMMTGYKKTVITVESDSAYTIATDEKLGSTADKTLSTSRRIGDCH